jgi:hypothetical protein
MSLAENGKRHGCYLMRPPGGGTATGLFDGVELKSSLFSRVS